MNNKHLKFMKLYFKNWWRDVCSCRQTWLVVKEEIITLVLEYRVLRMLSKKYPDGNMREPLDELSQRRYDKHIKRITNKIRNSDFHEINY